MLDNKVVGIPKRILYVGPLCSGGTCLQRMLALKELGHQVEGIDTEPPDVQKAHRRLPYRVRGKLFRMGFDRFGALDLAWTNDKIKDCSANNGTWDILWIDKGLVIEAETLYHFKSCQPNCAIVGYSPDDMAARHNQSRQFIQSLEHYDVFFTTKSYGVSELKDLGCPNVEFIGNAFDPQTHKPVRVGQTEKMEFGGSAGFIGAWEPERVVSMHYLASNGVPFRIWGTGWDRCKLRHPNLIVENKPLWAKDYARAICSFDINLCFLRKVNRDLQTTRSIEIPACGAFMLAERTDEHLDLFEEGREAAFFGTNDELLEKTRFYLSHPAERLNIATAGRERCLKDGYSNHERLKAMLSLVEQL